MKMKKIPLLCALLISFLGTACDKETDNDIDLSGSWQLISQISNDEEQELDERQKTAHTEIDGFGKEEQA